MAQYLWVVHYLGVHNVLLVYKILAIVHYDYSMQIATTRNA